MCHGPRAPAGRMLGKGCRPGGGEMKAKCLLFPYIPYPGLQIMCSDLHFYFIGIRNDVSTI